MSFLIKEYEIPFLGKVSLVEATRYSKSFNGAYYAENKQLGKGFCRDCNTFEELKEKVNEAIANYFKMRKVVAEQEIKEDEKRISKLECHLTETKYNDWMDKYQTDNPLQLEKQKKKK